MILKLKRTPGLFIVGFMGAGKSTVGRALARRLGWRFADLDEDIAAHEQMSVPEIFEKRGEAEFRKVEQAALQRRISDVSRGVPWVIAVGGGCYAQAENLDLMQNHGVTIWLDAPLDMLRARVGGAFNRPLARDPVLFEKLFDQRRPVYERADFRIVISSGGSDAAVDDILKLPLF
jgi:shikimate kinase